MRRHVAAHAACRVLVMVCVAASAAPALAQEPATVVRLARIDRVVVAASDPIGRMVRHHDEHNVGALEEAFLELVTLFNEGVAPQPPCVPIDPTVNAYRVLLRDPKQEDRLLSFMAQKQLEPYSKHLTRLRKRHLCELHFSHERFTEVTSSYALTPADDPLAAQLPALLQAIGLGGLGRATRLGIGQFKVLTTAQVKMSALGVEPEATIPIHAFPAAVTLHDPRGALEATDRLVVSASAVAAARRASRDGARLVANQGPLCPALIGTSAPPLIEAAYRARLDAIVQSCSDISVPACGDQASGTLDEAYRAGVALAAGEGAVCADVLNRVDQAYRAPFVAVPRKLTATTKYTVAPVTRFTYSALSSVVLERADAALRYKVEGGKFAPNPMTGDVLAAVGVNWFPLGYDPATPKRFRLHGFVGAAVSPQFGALGTVALALPLPVPVSLHFGGGWVLMDRPRHGESIDDAPVDRFRPLRLEWGRVMVFGLGFRFGG